MLNRILRLEMIPARRLRSSGPKIRAARVEQMSEVLDRIGWCVPLIARETPDGLELIDGHLRCWLRPDDAVPVIVLDVNEAEAKALRFVLGPHRGKKWKEFLANSKLEANMNRIGGQFIAVGEPIDEPRADDGGRWVLRSRPREVKQSYQSFFTRALRWVRNLFSRKEQA